ncbi:MAG: Fur family peroxide stress response transcriptional regulator [Sulfurimonas sp.]|jgi:Fur family peroxide stress response transcriptional regulator|uniref:Fur family transcriptional regulator n=1 Tax=Sulfurimonas sp. TaxID=2022749 RepID=UPI0039E6E94A
MINTTLLQKHNLKATPQRLEIVDVLSHNGHMNINDLYINLQMKFPSISLATIYKNVNIMLEKGFLLEVKLPDQKNVFELEKNEHSHVTCTKCSTVMDIDLDVQEILNKAQNVSNYHLSSNSLIFNGVCPRCLTLK